MGYKKLGLQKVAFDPFNKGAFPNKDFSDVPQGGSNRVEHVLWYRSALRKMFGMNPVNTTQAATLNGNGIFFMDVDGVQKQVAVFGTKFYEKNGVSFEDKTGAITITDGKLVKFINHQQNLNKYIIGVNGTDEPFKWTGSGNADVLGGSPPIFDCIAKYHDIVFGSVGEWVYFSAVGDPETWNTAKWAIPFDFDVKCILNNGSKLAVFKEYNTGSIQGYTYLDFVVEETEISNVGCVGKLAATNAIWGNNNTPVIATLAHDGLWIVDQSFGCRKLFGENYLQEFNQSNLYKASLAYNGSEHLLFCSLPYGASTYNDYMIVVDMQTGAFWPCPDIHTEYIQAMASMKDASGNEYIYFLDNNGFAYSFDPDVMNYHNGIIAEAIPSFYRTHRKDFGDIVSYRGSDMLADSDGDYNVNVSITMGLGSDGVNGTAHLYPNVYYLGTTFIKGVSTLGGGGTYIFSEISGMSGFGRFMHAEFSNSELNQEFHIRKYEALVKDRRLTGGSN